MSGTAPLSDRFRDHFGSLSAPAPGDTVVVALSGGLDSVVLLHLLRVTPGLPAVELVAAHLDHALRPGSPGDAAWVKGLCRAWGVPCRTHRLSAAPSSEEAARDARYAWLERVRDEERAAWILTAHHADDQAETILFRAVRGTGLRGLRGMTPVRRRGRIVRPLLPFWREELEELALAAGLTFREDASNRDRSFARNVLRHDVLPRLETEVAPGARRSLVRLGRLAGRAEAGFRSLLEGVLEAVVLEASDDRIVVARAAFLEHHPEVGARVMRELVRRLGSRLDEAGTRAALQFTYSGASGRALRLPGRIALARDFDRLVLHRGGGPGTGVPGEPPGDAVVISASGSGEDLLRTPDGSWRVSWDRGRQEEPAARDERGWSETFRLPAHAFPLEMRGWLPGDRMVLAYGTKKVSKLFGEARVPARDRPHRPVLVDGEGRVLWVPGVARGAGERGRGAGETRNGEARPGGRAPGNPSDGTEGGVLTISVHHADRG